MARYRDPDYRRDAAAYKKAYGKEPTARELATFRHKKEKSKSDWNKAYDIADIREKAAGRKPPKRPKSLRK